MPNTFAGQNVLPAGPPAGNNGTGGGQNHQSYAELDQFFNDPYSQQMPQTAAGANPPMDLGTGSLYGSYSSARGGSYSAGFGRESHTSTPNCLRPYFFPRRRGGSARFPEHCGTVLWRPSYDGIPNYVPAPVYGPGGEVALAVPRAPASVHRPRHHKVPAHAVGFGPEVLVAQARPRLPASVHRPHHDHKILDCALYDRRIGYPICSSFAPLVRIIIKPIDGVHGRRKSAFRSRMNEIEKMMGLLGINAATGKKAGMMICQKKVTAKEIHAVEPEPSSSVKPKQQESHGSCGDTKKAGSSSTVEFDQFVVLDLKATCLGKGEKVPDDKPYFKQEIIEFSSVLVDAATGDLKSSFHMYVRPEEFKMLTKFCMKYNEIKQEDVEKDHGAVTLSEALQIHKAWLQKNGGGGSAAVVTWGDWDCRTMLKQECFRKKVLVPDDFSRWINLKKPFENSYGISDTDSPIYRMLVQEAVRKSGLGWRGKTDKGGWSHVLNKARLLKLLILAGTTLAVTSWLDPNTARASDTNWSQ